MPSPSADGRENVAHGASRGITADREHTEPRSGDRRSAIIKTALSPLTGLFRRIGFAFSPRLLPWATFLRPPRRASEANRAYSCAYAPRTCARRRLSSRLHSDHFFCYSYDGFQTLGFLEAVSKRPEEERLLTGARIPSHRSGAQPRRGWT